MPDIMSREELMSELGLLVFKAIGSRMKEGPSFATIIMRGGLYFLSSFGSRLLLIHGWKTL